MKREIAEKWIAALNGGEFKQAKEVLRDGTDKYCCLGVLCELYRRETGQGEWDGPGFLSDSNFSCGSQADYSGSNLPEGVRQWAGMKTCSGTYGYYPFGINKEHKSLVYLNDHANFKFSGIASFIEKNWETL